MTTVLLVRHGRTTANAGGVLAGWSPDVHLDEKGREQAAALGQRLAAVPITAIVESPLDRCRETVDALVDQRDARNMPDRITDDDLGECRYGDWTGRELKTLAKDPLWAVVQAHPSAAEFPGDNGESLRTTQHRAVDAIRRYNRRFGDDATYAVCTHGDVIKAVVADALGMHLDLFQRIQVDPCSLTVIRYTSLRPFVIRLNDIGGSVADLLPQKRKRRNATGRRATRDSDAVVGGGTGADASDG